MSMMMWALPLYGLIMIAFGLYTFGIGLWGLLKKRPLVFAARQLMWFILAMYVPVTINSFVPLFQFSGRGDGIFDSGFWIVLPIFQVLMMVLLVFVFWRQMTGYMIFGVSDDTFRNALTSALNKLNLPYEETISKIKLTSLNADLQAAVAAWMGTAQIRIKQREHVHYTKEIANAMSEYYKDNVVKVNNIAFIVYLLLGIFMILFVIAFAIFGMSFFFFRF
jgi:hypothetical protein